MRRRHFDARHRPRGFVFYLPARGHRLSLRVEMDPGFAVEVGAPRERPARAREGEKRKGHRNRNVDAHLTDVHFVLEFSRSGSRASEDGGAVPVPVAVDQRDGVFRQAVSTYTHTNTHTHE